MGKIRRKRGPGSRIYLPVCEGKVLARHGSLLEAIQAENDWVKTPADAKAVFEDDEMAAVPDHPWVELAPTLTVAMVRPQEKRGRKKAEGGGDAEEEVHEHPWETQVIGAILDTGGDWGLYHEELAPAIKAQLADQWPFLSRAKKVEIFGQIGAEDLTMLYELLGGEELTEEDLGNFGAPPTSPLTPEDDSTATPAP